MRLFWKLALSLFIVGCAGHKAATPVVPTDKDFEVPSTLADQFAVREDGQQQVAVPVAEVAAPAPSAKKEKAGKKGKKKGMKTENGSAAKKAEAAAPAKPEVIPNRWTMPPMFTLGEKTTFDITYFGATAGQFTLETLPTKFVSGRSTYHFRGTAKSTSVFSLFYRVNDVAESFVDSEGIFSHKFSLKLDETRQARDVLELYDHQKKKAYYWSKLDHHTKGIINEQSEIDLAPFAQDGLSAFYYVRTLPLEVGKTYEFPLVNNGKLRFVRIIVLRKEELRTKIGEFKTIVVKPEVVLDGVLKSYGDSFIWISDDPKRMILKVDAKIKVGSVIAYLREYSSGEKASGP